MATIVVGIRMTVEEKAAMEKLAKGEGVSLSGLVILRVLGESPVLAAARAKLSRAVVPPAAGAEDGIYRNCTAPNDKCRRGKKPTCEECKRMYAELFADAARGQEIPQEMVFGVATEGEVARG